MSVVSSAWLFARGAQSVRIVRHEHPDGRIELLVYGPGPEFAAHTFPSVPACIQQQSEFERTLMAEGFTLRRDAERRTGDDRRRLTRRERRRPTSD